MLAVMMTMIYTSYKDRGHNVMAGGNMRLLYRRYTLKKLDDRCKLGIKTGSKGSVFTRGVRQGARGARMRGEKQLHL
jgi:hypothetical protein